MTKRLRYLWATNDRLSALFLVLMALLVLLLGALVIADRSMSQGLEQQAAADGATSALIVAQDVELIGERLHELGVTSREMAPNGGLGTLGDIGDQAKDLAGIWLFDRSASQVVDSVIWRPKRAHSVPRSRIQQAAEQAAEDGRAVLQSLPRSATGARRLALLAEPVLVDTGALANVVVAMVEERALLARAAGAAVKGRAFLALVANGDTVARATYSPESARRSQAVRTALPGEPQWFVVTAQTLGTDRTRWAIWLIGGAAMAALLLALLRERGQSRRITERSLELERLSAELLRANRVKSEFLASVSHELRTPLNAIVGFVELLRDGAYGTLTSKQASPVDRIASSASRLRLLVDQVLDMAKITAGRMDIRIEAVSVRPFLMNIVSEMEPLIQADQLDVRVIVEDGVPRVKTDPSHLRQILVNLLGNAVKYTERGWIEIRARIEHAEGPLGRETRPKPTTSSSHRDTQQQWLTIRVADTGVGIPEEEQARIFEEFEQIRYAELSGEQEKRGTGLGLPISRRLAVLLGGDITVQSQRGRGSVFTVWLPVYD